MFLAHQGHTVKNSDINAAEDSPCVLSLTTVIYF